MQETLERDGSIYRFAFSAMASGCEVRIDTSNATLASRLGRIAADEAYRIEAKFSRYRRDSIVTRINASTGADVFVDEETAKLIDFAAACFAASDGMFDITSGILRHAWRFDGSDRLPDEAHVESLRALVGWQKVDWRRPMIRLAPGMELDFGGIGKEYAVDRALALIRDAAISVPVLVNFGGDLAVSGPPQGGKTWNVGIESVDNRGMAAALLAIPHGAIATSGDSNRFLLRNGIRYSHILNPRTGWPVADVPRSVTVVAPTCIEAGMLATLAMLHGKDAEKYLEREGVRAWCMR